MDDFTEEGPEDTDNLNDNTMVNKLDAKSRDRYKEHRKEMLQQEKLKKEKEQKDKEYREEITKRKNEQLRHLHKEVSDCNICQMGKYVQIDDTKEIKRIISNLVDNSEDSRDEIIDKLTLENYRLKDFRDKYEPMYLQAKTTAIRLGQENTKLMKELEELIELEKVTNQVHKSEISQLKGRISQLEDKIADFQNVYETMNKTTTTTENVVDQYERLMRKLEAVNYDESIYN